MNIEPIGIFTFLLAALCFPFGIAPILILFVVTTLFGSAAALIIGDANIQPSQILLVFSAIVVFYRRRERGAGLKSLKFPLPGFWLLIFLVYGAFSAIFFPRMLAGLTQIIPLGTSQYANTASTVPLGPVSSNFTQTSYLIGDFLCFIMTVAVASNRRGFRLVVQAVIALVTINIALAAIDVATYSTGTSWLLAPIRNARYTLHNAEQIAGLKRIIGSFPEASAFANATLGAFGFAGTLWIFERRPILMGALAIISLGLIVFSTSSTGLAALLPLLLIMYLTLLMRGTGGAKALWQRLLLICGPPALFVGGLAVLMNDKMSEVIGNYLDILIFNKAVSASGIERQTWNAVAGQNFMDTYGLGVGLGTVRTSSFPLALLANVGVIGTALYLVFLARVLLVKRGSGSNFIIDARVAARTGCLGLIFGGLFSAPSVDQGLMFFILAGLACANPITP